MTKTQTFKWEYRRQRFIGNGIFKSLINAVEWALSPLPF